MPVCPKCGQAIIYIASPAVNQDKVYIVDAEEKRLITKAGRISVGYQEHKCQKNEGKGNVTTN